MFLLIDVLAVYGVILSGLLALWLEIFLLYRWGRSRFVYKFNFFKLIGLPASLGAMIALLEWIFQDDYSLTLPVMYILFCMVALFWVYRNELSLIQPLKIFKKT